MSNIIVESRDRMRIRKDLEDLKRNTKKSFNNYMAQDDFILK